jgi:hypothetical protein
MNPTLVCPRGCNRGFGPITNDFHALKGKKNVGRMVMTVTAECSGCGLLCDNEIEGAIDDFSFTTGTRSRR